MRKSEREAALYPPLASLNQFRLAEPCPHEEGKAAPSCPLCRFEAMSLEQKVDHLAALGRTVRV